MSQPSFPFRLFFTPKAYRQVQVRWTKDEAFRRKFPFIVSELLTKGTKGDAKHSNWTGIWGDRFDRDSYRIYWRKFNHTIVFVGVFHKDQTDHKGSPGEILLSKYSAMEPTQLPFYSSAKTNRFLHDVVGIPSAGEISAQPVSLAALGVPLLLAFLSPSSLDWALPGS